MAHRLPFRESGAEVIIALLQNNLWRLDEVFIATALRALWPALRGSPSIAIRLVTGGGRDVVEGVVLEHPESTQVLKHAKQVLKHMLVHGARDARRQLRDIRHALRYCSCCRACYFQDSTTLQKHTRLVDKESRRNHLSGKDSRLAPTGCFHRIRSYLRGFARELGDVFHLEEEVGIFSHRITKPVGDVEGISDEDMESETVLLLGVDPSVGEVEDVYANVQGEPSSTASDESLARHVAGLMHRFRKERRFNVDAMEMLILFSKKENIQVWEDLNLGKILAAALKRFPRCKPIQWRACTAVTNFAERSEALAADFAKRRVVPQLLAVFKRFPGDAAMQQQALWALNACCTHEPAKEFIRRDEMMQRILAMHLHRAGQPPVRKQPNRVFDYALAKDIALPLNIRQFLLPQDFHQTYELFEVV